MTEIRSLHPTMVRLQRGKWVKNWLEASLSPSHYGSTATWLYRVTIKLELSLHPTMVRLQQRR